MMNIEEDGIQDWRKSAKGQARIQRVQQFLLEYTEEGEGFHVSYITLKHHYYSWCQSIGIPREECGFGELIHVLDERAKLRYEPTIKVVGMRMKHPVGLPRYDTRKPLSPSIKKAVHAKLSSNGNVCALCRQPILPEDSVHIDHIQRVRRGGSDESANLQVVHARCNLTKG